MSIHRRIIQLMSAVDQPRRNFGAATSDIAESNIRKGLFSRFHPISEKIFSQTGKITPEGSWGFSPHQALRRAGGLSEISASARKTQNLIPEARTALEQDVSEINFEELDKKDRKFKIVEKLHRFLHILSIATIGTGAAIALITDAGRSLGSDVGLKISIIGLASFFVLGGIKRALQYYLKPDVLKINYIIDRAKQALNELERSLKDLSDTATGFFK